MAVVRARDVLPIIQAGDTVHATRLCKRILVDEPGDGDTLHLYGVTELRRNLPRKAAEWFARAVRLLPSDGHIYANLAVARRTAGDLSGSARALRRALALDPAHAEILYNFANLFKALGQHVEALLWYRAAAAVKPGEPKIHHNCANLLFQLNRFDEARCWGEHAWEMSSGRWPAVAVNLGMTSYMQGRWDEAIAWYDEAIAVQSQDAAAHFNRGLALLLTGRFAEGWTEYSWRWRMADVSKPDLTGPAWRGDPVPESTILVHVEQGFGDTINFVRYLPLVAERCRHVVLQCQPALCTLLAESYPDVTVVSEGDPLPLYDSWVALLDLPGIFGAPPGPLPGRVPYLRVSAAAQRGAGEELSVGFVWAGSEGHRNDHLRSLDVRLFAPLMGTPGVRPFSLQVGPRAADINVLESGHRVSDLASGVESFRDTAERLMRLDLLITVDTSMAHLAGALGLPVWILLAHAPDWRWMLDRTDTPWYPSATLFRQDRHGDWSRPLRTLAETLQQAVFNRTCLKPEPSKGCCL